MKPPPIATSTRRLVCRKRTPVPARAHLLFVGQQNYYRDSEIDLYMLGMGNADGGGREYDPATGTFLSEDPAEDDLNPYRYVANNPINAVDPSGLQQYPYRFDEATRQVLGKSRAEIEEFLHKEI